MDKTVDVSICGKNPPDQTIRSLRGKGVAGLPSSGPPRQYRRYTPNTHDQAGRSAKELDQHSASSGTHRDIWSQPRHYML